MMNKGDVMNTLVKALVLSISTALIATSVMAAPQQHQSQQNNHHDQQQGNASAQHQIQSNHTPQSAIHKSQPQKSVSHKSINPSRDWKVGQKVPNQYYTSSYKVDHSKYKKLTKPARNQQWIKVNGDYVLTNMMSHTVIKIING